MEAKLKLERADYEQRLAVGEYVACVEKCPYFIEAPDIPKVFTEAFNE